MKKYFLILCLSLLPAAACAQVKDAEMPVMCPMDAKLCPDGSSVGRTGPHCEFKPCPGEPGYTPPSDLPPSKDVAVPDNEGTGATPPPGQTDVPPPQ